MTHIRGPPVRGLFASTYHTPIIAPRTTRRLITHPLEGSTMNNYARFRAPTTGGVNFIVDVRKDEDALAKARAAVASWNSRTGSSLELCELVFLCVLRY